MTTFFSTINKIQQILDLKLLSSSNLFDKTWYLKNNLDVKQAGIDPLLHYYRYGGFEGRDPSPKFNSKWYLDTYPDVKQSGINPLVHYLRIGVRERRYPNSQTIDQINTLRASDLYNETWFLDHYPKARKAKMDPLLYYLEYGGFTEQDPGPNFSSSQYLDNYPDVKAAGINPLFHYLVAGRSEGRVSSRDSWKTNIKPSKPNKLRALSHSILVDHQTILRSVQSISIRKANAANNLESCPKKSDLKNISKEITFFVTEMSEFQALQPVARMANLHGFKTSFSFELDRHADIGIYVQHRFVNPNANLSIVMFHDIGQYAWPECPSFEPNHWADEPWNSFDIGVLPGRAWSQCWYSVSDSPNANPRLGVFELGWPKADPPYNQHKMFIKDVNQLRTRLHIKDLPSVLYAPSWENNGKQEDFIKSLSHLPINLLIKQASWPDANNRRRIREIMNGRQELYKGDVYFIDPDINIMSCLAISDVLVSDESNCLVEALLFEVPGISVRDWQIPAIPWWDPPLPPRLPDPPKSAIRTTRNELGNAVEDVLKNRDKLRPIIRQYRDHYFSHIGISSELINICN